MGFQPKFRERARSSIMDLERERETAHLQSGRREIERAWRILQRESLEKMNWVRFFTGS